MQLTTATEEDTVHLLPRQPEKRHRKRDGQKGVEVETNVSEEFIMIVKEMRKRNKRAAARSVSVVIKKSDGGKGMASSCAFS